MKRQPFFENSQVASTLIVLAQNCRNNSQYVKSVGWLEIRQKSVFVTNLAICFPFKPKSFVFNKRVSSREGPTSFKDLRQVPQPDRSLSSKYLGALLLKIAIQAKFSYTQSCCTIHGRQALPLALCHSFFFFFCLAQSQ